MYSQLTPRCGDYSRSVDLPGLPFSRRTLYYPSGILNELTILQAQLESYDRIFLIVDALDETTAESRSFVEEEVSEISERLSLLTTKRVDEERSENFRFCDKCKKKANFYYHCFDCDQQGEKSDLCFDCKRLGSACMIDPSHELSIPESIEVIIWTPKRDLEIYVRTAIKRQMPKGSSGNQRNGRRVDVDMIPRNRNSTPLGRKCLHDEELFKRIVSVVTNNAGGKFLFAKLYIDNLSSQLTMSDINKAMKEIMQPLNGFPDMMTKLYDNAMNDRICQQDKNLKRLALRTLALVTCAHRTLRLKEIRHALAVEPGDTDYSQDNDVDDTEILNATKGLILIDRDKDQYVRFFHFTLVAYFENTKSSWFPDGEIEIANICLTYLSFDVFAVPCPNPEEFQAKEEKYPFVTYAVQYWGDHVRITGKEVQLAAIKYLQDSNRVNAYVQAAWATDTHKRDKWDVRRDIHPLHVCAWFDLVPLVSELKDNLGPNVTENTYGQTSLMYACRRGHVQVARCLLGFGASVNKKSDRGRTAMIEAVLRKKKEVVNLLLNGKLYDEKLEINAVNPQRDNRTALMVAAVDGSTEICQALLKHHNILINLQDALGFTALSMASSMGFVEIVKSILTTTGVDINLTDREGGRSALILAAEGNHSKIIELLLQHSADPESKDSTGGTAVLRTIENGCTDAFQELIKFGVDLNCVDERGRSLMHGAVENRH
jgi:ankyrin repeat protein